MGTVPNVLRLELNNENLTFTRLENLRETIERAQSNRSHRVLVLDLNLVRVDPDTLGPIPADHEHRSVLGSHGPGPIVEQQLIKALRNFLKPSIALIGPSLFDFGIDIASACDVRIARGDSVISDTRVSTGRTAASGIAYLLPRLVGLSQAMRISFLGEPLSAAEALRINFLHQVIEQESFEAQAEEFVSRVSKMPTRAWEVHKMQVLPQLDQDFETAMVHSLGIRQTHVIKDRLEGIRAWRERRDPEFKGE
ncbi:MAG: enoyl-CoA hydratase/isomerase family protein [Gammaproteobacteria bacterium]|nr:enoyl-CoA hydratase/isomerase family protein [Gammaproteobacteria bacterium]